MYLGLVEKQILQAKTESLVSPPVSVSPPSSVSSAATSVSEREFKIKEFNYEESKLQLEAARITADRKKRSVREKQIDKELEIKILENQHELNLKKLEYEAHENERQREFQRQGEREEQNFALKKLELELAVKGLIVASPVPPVFPSQVSQPSSPVCAPVHPAVPLSVSDSAVQLSAPMGDSVTAPPLSVPMVTSDAAAPLNSLPVQLNNSNSVPFSSVQSVVL